MVIDKNLEEVTSFIAPLCDNDPSDVIHMYYGGNAAIRFPISE